MQKIVLLCFNILIFAACKKECENFEPCLEAKIEAFKVSPMAVSLKSIQLDDATYVWFNTNATHWDGIEYILSETCDTVCYFCGECEGPDCADDYWNADWETFWEK